MFIFRNKFQWTPGAVVKYKRQKNQFHEKFANDARSKHCLACSGSLRSAFLGRRSCPSSAEHRPLLGRRSRFRRPPVFRASDVRDPEPVQVGQEVEGVHRLLRLKPGLQSFQVTFDNLAFRRREKSPNVLSPNLQKCEENWQTSSN